jgi:hypothetical protein
MRMRSRIPHLTPAERRLRREAQSAALCQRAFALRQTGATYAAIGGELGLSLERARQIVRKAERLALHPHWSDDLPTRANHVLYAHGLLDRPELEAAHALAQFSARELMQRANLGRVSLAALCAWLARHGLALRDEGGPSQSRLHDSEETDPFAPGRNEHETPCPYTTPKT